MTKKIDPDLAKGLKEMAKGHDKEYSIGLDFERYQEQPERVIVVEGGKGETIKINDFEMFGHTHPGHTYAIPSSADLRNLEPLKPEFIIAGKSGKMTIFNIEDEKKYEHWRKQSQKYFMADNSLPINDKMARNLKHRKKYKNDINVNVMSDKDLSHRIVRLNDPKSREMFFDLTGVRAYPYRKVTYVEMKDDPKPEKAVPTIPKQQLKKYHNE